jgi:hypothetical protein
LEGKSRGTGSGGKGDDLNAIDRPNRRNAAAASQDNEGRSIDHGAA